MCSFLGKITSVRTLDDGSKGNCSANLSYNGTIYTKTMSRFANILHIYSEKQACINKVLNFKMNSMKKLNRTKNVFVMILVVDTKNLVIQVFTKIVMTKTLRKQVTKAMLIT